MIIQYDYRLFDDFFYVTITRSFSYMHKTTNRQLKNMPIISSLLQLYSRIGHYNSSGITYRSSHTRGITVAFSHSRSNHCSSQYRSVLG